MDKPAPEILAALQIRIAELMEWKFLRLSTYRDKRPVYTHPQTGLSTTELPDFTDSLDAIHEAILALTGTEKARKHDLHMIFEQHLYRVLAESIRMPGTYEIATADALTLCIALDRTLSPDPII